MLRIVTIGGYGFTERSFIDTLSAAHVDTFVDVRQRRGMRGAKYAFLNSKRLQHLLLEAGIRYIHAFDLAPTTSVREAQKTKDDELGIGKRARSSLSLEFVDRYNTEILGSFRPDDFQRKLEKSQTVALFCVEASPSACHRSVAAEHLAQALQADPSIEHLMP